MISREHVDFSRPNPENGLKGYRATHTTRPLRTSFDTLLRNDYCNSR